MLCNNPTEHDFWATQNLNCPYCTAIRKNEESKINRERELDKLADLIVEKLLARIHENS